MSPRIVTACIEGTTAKWHEDPVSATKDRIEWTKELASFIDNRWRDLDGVLFPGGFLFANGYVGNLNYNNRVSRLNDLGLGLPMSAAAGTLKQSPGALIVAGVDGDEPSDEVDADQLCVAWNSAGIVGIGRKIYPVAGEEADGLVCYTADYSTPNRRIKLKSEGTAMLCACYDGYAISRASDQGRNWNRHVLNISQEGQDEDTWAEATPDQVASLKQAFGQSLSGVNVALVTIHSFEGNSTGYWQRHGLERASSALGKAGIAYGAAHFETNLPSKSSVSVLAAKSGAAFGPKDWFTLESRFGRAMVRLYAESA